MKPSEMFDAKKAEFKQMLFDLLNGNEEEVIKGKMIIFQMVLPSIENCVSDDTVSDASKQLSIDRFKAIMNDAKPLTRNDVEDIGGDFDYGILLMFIHNISK